MKNIHYLNDYDIRSLGNNWLKIVETIDAALCLQKSGDIAQPIKPYLRYKDKKNRIIAMPAYVGGKFHIAGIKWIASFPDNLKRGISRAHSTIILNDADTGEPSCIINTPLVSGIRTSGLSAKIIHDYLQEYRGGRMNFGILGFGPIARLHIDMLLNLFGEKIDKILVYDIQPISQKDVDKEFKGRIRICTSWQEVFNNSQILITCTSSSSAYINLQPAKGTLHLNVSLRDYQPEFMNSVDLMVVDDWEEVCRENTDVENMHMKQKLSKEDTVRICDVASTEKLRYSAERIIMVNPMGMAIFDIAVGKLFLDLSLNKCGVLLNS